jgi:hypothetical protein
VVGVANVAERDGALLVLLLLVVGPGRRPRIRTSKNMKIIMDSHQRSIMRTNGV